jgi:hypothetical protein
MAPPRPLLPCGRWAAPGAPAVIERVLAARSGEASRPRSQAWQTGNSWAVSACYACCPARPPAAGHPPHAVWGGPLTCWPCHLQPSGRPGRHTSGRQRGYGRGRCVPNAACSGGERRACAAAVMGAWFTPWPRPAAVTRRISSVHTRIDRRAPGTGMVARMHARQVSTVRRVGARRPAAHGGAGERLAASRTPPQEEGQRDCTQPSAISHACLAGLAYSTRGPCVHRLQQRQQQPALESTPPAGQGLPQRGSGGSLGAGRRAWAAHHPSTPSPCTAPCRHGGHAPSSPHYGGRALCRPWGPCAVLFVDRCAGSPRSRKASARHSAGMPMPPWLARHGGVSLCGSLCGMHTGHMHQSRF